MILLTRTGFSIISSFADTFIHLGKDIDKLSHWSDEHLVSDVTSYHIMSYDRIEYIRRQIATGRKEESLLKNLLSLIENVKTREIANKSRRKSVEKRILMSEDKFSVEECVKETMWKKLVDK